MQADQYLGVQFIFRIERPPPYDDRTVIMGWGALIMLIVGGLLLKPFAYLTISAL